MKLATFNEDFDIVFNSCIQTLKNLDITLNVADKKNKTITGTTKSSLWSWGENIQLNFEKVNQYSTKVEVESTSTAQLFAWGKNEQNEKMIIESINNILKK
jgi:alpha-tubulin suppressor-like RCC1 family protein